MNEKTIEVYILEEGKFILFQTFIEMKEIMEEVGQYQFDFTLIAVEPKKYEPKRPER